MMTLFDDEQIYKVFENDIKQETAKEVARACLKIHSRHLHAPLCGIFDSHSVNVARYAFLIRVQSTTNCDAQLSESNFQTCSGNKAVFMIQKGKIAMDEIAEYFPELSEEDRKEIESQVLQQVQHNRSVATGGKQ